MLRRFPLALRGPLLGVLLLGAGGSAVAAPCGGRDLLPELRAEAPAMVAEIERDAGSVPFGRGKLFRITAPGKPESYLFGTIHLADPRVATLAPTILGAIARSRVVALELEEAGGIGQAGLLQDLGLKGLGSLLARIDERPDRLLAPPDFTRLEAAVMGRGLPVSAARSVKPTVLALMLGMPACALSPAATAVLDAVVARAAKEGGIGIIGLETPAEQLAALSGFRPDEARDLLVASLALAERAEDVVETTVARYREGELGLLLAWMKSSRPVPGVAPSPVPDVFFDRMVDERNRRMRDRVLPLLAEGGVFVAVGAAHLPGERGLARLIEGAGYRVEAVGEEPGP